MEAGKITKYANSSKGRGSFRHFVKKLANRKRRRLGKTYLDDCPKIVTKGYAD
jgi:hypothetical protein